MLKNKTVNNEFGDDVLIDRIRKGSLLTLNKPGYDYNMVEQIYNQMLSKNLAPSSDKNITEQIKNLIIENLPDDQKGNETLVNLYKYCVGIYFILNKYILDNVKDGKASIIKEPIRDVIIKKKYYKYKNKYLKLKELIGGAKPKPTFISLEDIKKYNYFFTVSCDKTSFSTVKGKSSRGNNIIYLKPNPKNISGFEVESRGIGNITYYRFSIKIGDIKYNLCGDNSEGNLILQQNPTLLSKFKIVKYDKNTFSLFIMTD